MKIVRIGNIGNADVLLRSRLGIVMAQVFPKWIADQAIQTIWEPDENRIYVIALTDDGEIAGFSGLYFGFSDTYHSGKNERVWLTYTGVSPDYQRSGVGRKLLLAAETIAREVGYRYVFIETYDNEYFRPARNFYEAMGYSRAGCLLNYTPEGDAAVYYTRGLERI